MRPVEECASLAEVRANIDRIDRQIVDLLAERIGYVKQAPRFKSSADQVRIEERIEEVVSNVTARARECGACPQLVERVYRELIDAHIDLETAEYAALHGGELSDRKA